MVLVQHVSNPKAALCRWQEGLLLFCIFLSIQRAFAQLGVHQSTRVPAQGGLVHQSAIPMRQGRLAAAFALFFSNGEPVAAGFFCKVRRRIKLTAFIFLGVLHGLKSYGPWTTWNPFSRSMHGSKTKPLYNPQCFFLFPFSIYF